MIIALCAALYIVVLVGVTISIDEEPLEEPALPWGFVVVFWPVGLALCATLLLRRAAKKK